tara:strand:+ start:23047 stop:24573 length:1527 start_codon:yes stop_codon:yes gene_type:complete
MNNTNNQNIINDDIDFKKIFRSLRRNIKFISLFTLFGAITSTIITLSKKDIWQGDFQIIVTNDKPAKSNKFQGLENFSSLIQNDFNDNRTQLEILKSPSVLLPVFKYVKEAKKLNNDNFNNLNYENWLNNNLEINFKNNTSVLEIKYMDKNKELIIKALELISSKYQDYSKSDHEKNLNQTQTFLTSQINEIRKKANNAKKQLNAFSLQNNIGTSMVDSDLISSDLENYELKSQIELGNNPESRYKYLFEQLIDYESQYLTLSNNYKQTSPTLVDLKTKIDNIKTLLRRPTEILFEFNELQANAIRQSSILSDLERDLALVKLSIARQKDPWKLISDPKIRSIRYAPNRKKDLLFGSILSLFLSVVVSFIREDKMGIIYELEDLKRNKAEKYFGKLYKFNKEFNDEIIDSILLEQNIKIKDSQVGILSISKNFLDKNNNFSKNNFFSSNKIKVINNLDIASIKKCDLIITLYSLGEISFEHLNKTNDLLRMFNPNIIGWMIIDNNDIS